MEHISPFLRHKLTNCVKRVSMKSLDFNPEKAEESSPLPRGKKKVYTFPPPPLSPKKGDQKSCLAGGSNSPSLARLELSEEGEGSAADWVHKGSFPYSTSDDDVSCPQAAQFGPKTPGGCLTCLTKTRRHPSKTKLEMKHMMRKEGWESLLLSPHVGDDNSANLWSPYLSSSAKREQRGEGGEEGSSFSFHLEVGRTFVRCWFGRLSFFLPFFLADL